MRYTTLAILALPVTFAFAIPGGSRFAADEPAPAPLVATTTIDCASQCGWTYRTECMTSNDVMLYDPYTDKCYNTKKHPSPYNCAWQSLAYDKNTKQCVAPKKAAPDCHSKCMLYDYKTENCYDPAKHPGNFECSLKGQFYDKQKNVCCDKKPAA